MKDVQPIRDERALDGVLYQRSVQQGISIHALM